MQKIITAVILAGLLAAPAFADHDHSDKKKAQSAAEHAGHGVMPHGIDNTHAGHDMKSHTMPADGAVLHHSPKQVGVNFGHAMTVEAITISTLTGERIELDVSDVGKTDHVMVTVPELLADDYSVDWRARGDDGHIMSGSFSFTIE